MTSTALVWLRRDLRVHDNPALVAALAEHDRVVPVFVLDPRLLGGRFPSPDRAAFLLGCLSELAGDLRARGGALALREGSPADELARLARDTGAEAAYWASDVSPFAMARDRAAREALEAVGCTPRPGPGNFCADIGALSTRKGGPYTVFSPFHRAWEAAARRPVHRAPGVVRVPSDLRRGRIPGIAALGLEPELDEPPEPGEAAGRARMELWLRSGIERYEERHDRLAGGTSGMSPYLRFGCVSARELEARAGRRSGKGPAAFRRQLGWRDFYAHVLLKHPGNARREFQERYRSLRWERDGDSLDAWKAGRTGYPVVDAAMRQLGRTGWMHNRARLIVGSFLTKDLHIDWREGEAHFMRLLIDGDEASNNGNWQWVSSVGVDPSPYFQRLFNPMLQQRRFDPDGEYVRRWVPELESVPDEHLAEPWEMDDEQQRAARCVIGRDYPAPIVDHARERRRAIERYRAV